MKFKKLFCICVGMSLSVSAFAADDAAKEDTTPPPAIGALPADQIPPVFTPSTAPVTAPNTAPAMPASPSTAAPGTTPTSPAPLSASPTAQHVPGIIMAMPPEPASHS